MIKRPTIVDVARRAGVSTAVVSYALNGRPGVSAETRERVLRIAAECGWRPSAAARSLRAGPRSIGLVLPAGGGSFAGEDGLLQFVGGLQSVLAGRRIRALLHLADGDEDAVDVCAQWWAAREVFAVVIPDVQRDDRRVHRLRGLGIPVVGLEGPHTGGPTATPMVWSDDAAAFGKLAEYLLSLGHRRIARVVGRPELAVSAVRQQAFDDVASRIRVQVRTVVVATTAQGGAMVEAEAAVEGAVAVTRQLLQSPGRPSVIVYDEDAMAISALDLARRLGLDVPRELSVVAGADSLRCRLVTPSLTALARDFEQYGQAAGQQLLGILAGAVVEHRQVATATLIVRDSTGPAAA